MKTQSEWALPWFAWVWIGIALGTYVWTFFLGWSAGVAITTGGLFFSALMKWAVS